MQNAAVTHPLKSGIAEEEILHHLPGVVVVLLAQIDAEPCHSGKNDLACDPQMRDAAFWLSCGLCQCDPRHDHQGERRGKAC